MNVECHLIGALQRVLIPPTALSQPRADEGSVIVHDHPDDRALRAAILANRLDLDLALPVQQSEGLPVEGWPGLVGGQ